MPIQRLDTLLALKALSLAPGLTENDRRVAAALIEHFNRQTERCDPSLNRIADLIQISRRTVIRSTKRLERAGFFKKIRHGGLSHRNRYEPNWQKFREVEAQWNIRLAGKHVSAGSKLSPSSVQSCHPGGDTAVTQTFRVNLLNQTYERGLPKKKKRRNVLSLLSERRSTKGVPSDDAADAVAERRWSAALHEQFKSMPLTYGEIVDAITPEIQAAATRAERRKAGSGFEYILDQLKLHDSWSPNKGQRGS